ncbi:Beta-glucanase/Beta-glucan synthetase [Aquiflexum balticum DSM 16537]|uniref:Beta-glucanase/Beta-glucan synthetase n=1 Tax=Aquiflexum balticum DSM 16537 TaxID=758820 RepID=A0A1W2H415_9BACT|nr:glycoside hydrolase family 16 protein [Aquiflexum balticum]SMD43673.1 Beta-glucanase/Beta-glucan synthetase [Aquiflexum balticum DSM 16537]
MKNIILPMIVFGFLLSCQEKPNNKLIWSDEFEYEGLPDTVNWTYDVGDHGWGNNELQFYTKEKSENARVENGRLIIEAHLDSSFTKGFSSAKLHTKGNASWQYGYMEIKAKLPSGVGTWPAIWMMPEENKYGGWPKSGEIDIMEHVGYDQGVIHGTVHAEAFNHRKGTQKGAKIQVLTCSEEFHVYAIDWSEDRIDFYLDGKQYHTFENTGKGFEEWPFDHPFYLILNIAVGGDWGGTQGVDPEIWPQRMEVDYVRVYSEKPD